MAKVDYRKLPAEERTALKKEWRTFLENIGIKKEGVTLVEQMLTESERIMLARRMRIARRLLHGEGFLFIAKKLHVSVNTVHSVDRWLQEQWSDYRHLLSKQKNPYAKEDHYSTHFLGELRYKYPGKMVLLNLLLGGDV